jgi:hypothetical protein
LDRVTKGGVIVTGGVPPELKEEIKARQIITKTQIPII